MMLLTVKPTIEAAVNKMVPLLHDMTVYNLGDTFAIIDEIRKTLPTEQDELQVISLLISLGEL
jgi:hypothetical protein